MRRLAASLLLLILAAGAGQAGTLRIATFNTELSRDGPGLLLRDIERGSDPQIAAVVEVISAAQPDVLALQGIDWDYEGRSLAALAGLLAEGVFASGSRIEAPREWPRALCLIFAPLLPGGGFPLKARRQGRGHFPRGTGARLHQGFGEE